MTVQEIRQAYLQYFKDKGHHVIPSASLLPENDPTTLFTGSGMQPMVPYLLGESHPEGVRIADSQKCFRSGDIDEVGDNRHTTFFEMLGNWSLGDYFKTEQVDWIWDFLVNIIGLNPNQLYITCFRGSDEFDIPKDTEAALLWQKKFEQSGMSAEIVDFPEKDGMQNGRIFYYDSEKNWWSRAGVPQNMPNGEPGGPDSEMFWDFGVEQKHHEKSVWKDDLCHVNCDCGRFMEIGNNVFMAYRKMTKDFTELEKKNIDFGGGLERIAAAVIGNPDIFLIDIFSGAKKTLADLSGKVYGENEKETFAFRVIMDHIRAAVFLIADGAVPSNKDQGYFTRRLIRRAVRFSKDLGITQSFCASIARSFITSYSKTYTVLAENESHIISALQKEEGQFQQTLESGLKEFEKLLAGFKKGEEKTGRKVTEISGKQAFTLYDTFGFPFEMTEELAKERGLSVDRSGFGVALEKHKQTSRSAAEEKFKGGLADTSEMSVKYHTATHLLHVALRRVLGTHVEQKGSNITPKRLRFDFTHTEKVTDEQKKEVEDLVNAAIVKGYTVSSVEMSIEEAKTQGAIGLFSDSYGERVKVYTIGDPNFSAAGDPASDTFSKEICGGPHVENTNTLGHFRITKEESSSAGIRRIKAVLE
ncbi:MAG: alanine--tRNA ligase [Candidatus Magasanikbacteria bacterium]|nr:alanine--tRNA ligase [Candidatus Magasanikbacteria bacterium]